MSPFITTLAALLPLLSLLPTTTFAAAGICNEWEEESEAYASYITVGQATEATTCTSSSPYYNTNPDCDGCSLTLEGFVEATGTTNSTLGEQNTHSYFDAVEKNTRPVRFQWQERGNIPEGLSVCLPEGESGYGLFRANALCYLGVIHGCSGLANGVLVEACSPRQGENGELPGVAQLVTTSRDYAVIHAANPVNAGGKLKAVGALMALAGVAAVGLVMA